MHNVGLNTSVQSWSKPFAWTFTSILFFAHSFCFFIGLLVAPQLFSSSSIVGRICHIQNLSIENGQEHNTQALSNCNQLKKVSNIPPVPLEDAIISFRFPQPSNEVNSYTPMNWRLLGSLLLEVTFDGAATFPPTTLPTFSTNVPTIKYENKTELEVIRKGLRLKTKIKDKEEGGRHNNQAAQKDDVNLFKLYKESIEVSMHAELMIEETLSSNEDVGQHGEEQFTSTNVKNSIPLPKNETVEFDEATWVKKHDLTATRKLQCTYASFARSITAPRTELHNGNVADIKPTKPTKDKLERDKKASVTYTCTLTPLFDLLLVNTNASYLIRIHFMSPLQEQSTDDDNLVDAESTKEPSEKREYNKRYRIEKGRVESSILNSPAARMASSLTLLTEVSEFHSALMISKCIFIPFVMAALCLFCIRTYLNDLYVAIPDRLLITSAMAVILHNIPIEVFIKYFGEYSWSSYLKVADELMFLLPMISLMLFWCIFTGDKLARNEPWERNTRYYCLPLLIVVMSAFVAGLFVIYSFGDPVVSSPFNSHWLEGSSAVRVSIGLLFTLAALALTYQTYLAISVFRVLCDISVSYSTSTTVLRMWRLKMALLYSFVVSLLTIGGYVLKLAIQLGLNWNPQFYLEPIPFHLSLASSYLLGLHGMWNLHVIALLIMLSRCPRNPHEYVRPVGYNYACSSVDQNGHHSVPCDECLQGGYQYHLSHHQRRQSSEDFLDYQQTRDNIEIRDTLCGGCRVKEYGNILTDCTCHLNDNNMIEMKCLSTANASSSEHPMANFVEATNCHHHYFWQATHASDGDQVYMEEELDDDNHYNDGSDDESENDDDLRVESKGSVVDNESDEHNYFDNSQDDTDAFFDHHHHSRVGGAGGCGNGAMILPSSGRIER